MTSMNVSIYEGHLLLNTSMPPNLEKQHGFELMVQ